MSIGVVLIGRSTVEAIPLYHLHPGGCALRLLAKPSKTIECGFDSDICDWAKGPEAIPSFMVDVRIIDYMVSKWGCELVFLDGLEPLESIDAKVIRNGLSPLITIASRAHGFVEVNELIDYYLVEDLSILSRNLNMRRPTLKVIDELYARGKPVEVLVYIENPVMDEVGEFTEVLEGKNVPLHVSIYNPRGGGPVRRLYEELKRKLKYVYVHTRTYDEIDTLCPRCGTILIHRYGNMLKAVNLKNGTCPKCGENIPVTGVIRSRTSEALMRVARGGVTWYNPLFFKSMAKS